MFTVDLNGLEMAGNLLIKVLLDEIHPKDLFAWITGENSEAEFRCCSRADFVSYFLNYVHDEAPRSAAESDSCEESVVAKKPPDELPESFTASPVSPLYANFKTPKTKRQQPEICLGDFITPQKISSSSSSAKKRTHRRRINPTKLSLPDDEKFRTPQNSFNFRDDFVELPTQRRLLAEERDKILTKLPGARNFRCVDRIKAKGDPDSVTNRKELDCLVEIYSYLVKSNMILNLTSELYFLVTLLSTRRFQDDTAATIINTHMLSSGEINLLVTNEFYLKTLLKSVDNVIYFAVKTLSSLTDVLQLLDRSTIKLFAENDYVGRYSKSLQLQLSTILEEKSERSSSSRSITENLQRNVCFVSDTDNRENFPTDASFHAFRKQRDLFYEMLRIWEQNHGVPGWNFALALGGKIRSLLNLHNDAVNYRHFARLFTAQLLTCKKHCCVEQAETSFLSSIPPDKLHRLKSRLVTRDASNGINCVPQFPGHQDFYKEFIVLSAMRVFHVHLRDALILQILELDDTKFNGEFDVDSTTRSSYLACVKSLRILAKFLGFLESLPYSKHLLEKMLASEIETRRFLTPSFDLKGTIVKAIKTKTLVLTIPWLAEYLSMLDYVTLRLPYYEDVLELLFDVQHLNHHRVSASLNVLLIRLCLGWLFELPHFPGHSYLRRFSQKSAPLSEDTENKNLDDLNIVDQTVLYTCCPYLDELKKLLASSTSCDDGNASIVKRITPLSSVESPGDVSEKKLKAQLEEAFFNGQPVSVKKTVEFVSERVASTCVKFICNSVIPDSKKSSLLEFRSSIQNSEASENVALKMKADAFAARCLKIVQAKCLETAEAMMCERIPTSIDFLLSSDELIQTKEACFTIARRMCSDRVRQWVNSHVNLGVFSKDFYSEVDGKEKPAKDKPTFILPPGGRNVNHNPDALSAVKIVETIRMLSLRVVEKECEESVVDDVTEILDSTRKSICERCDFNDSILSVVNKMLVDLLLLILTHCYDVASDDGFLLKFVDHWKSFGGDLFKTVICPRNVRLMGQSKDVTKSRLAFTNLLTLLLRNGLLSHESLESQWCRNDEDCCCRIVLSDLF